MVIAIAIIVGGLISSFCIGVIAYMLVKAYKNRGKDFLDPQEDGSPIPEEQKQLNTNDRRRKLRIGYPNDLAENLDNEGTNY